MKKKLFISYSDYDKKKVEIIKRKFAHNPDIELIIVADRKSKMIPLALKVTEGMKSANIFIPILTRNSISTQWINQEIGYCTLLIEKNQNLEIIPVVETQIIGNLKGFIHEENDLSFNYKGNEQDTLTENKAFRKTINLLFNYLSPSLTQKIESANELSFLEKFIIGKKLHFVYNPRTKNSKIIEFISNGNIGEGRNNNEYRWKIDQDRLIIYNNLNQVYSRFYYDIGTNSMKNTNEADTLSLRDQFITRTE